MIRERDTGKARQRVTPGTAARIEHSFARRSLALAAALCALAGCAVPMQTVDASRAACAFYGFQPGSDAFAECVQKEQHVHTLVFLGGHPTVPMAGPSVDAGIPQAPELWAPQAQAPAIAMPPLPQLRTQFCFRASSFEQCQ
jgi:hypothetical protein